MNHTPGPWIVVAGDWGDTGNARYELEGVKTMGVADARLIAAAPLLLALLKELVDLEGPQPGNSAWGIKANALIAKAMGKAA